MDGGRARGFVVAAVAGSVLASCSPYPELPARTQVSETTIIRSEVDERFSDGDLQRIDLIAHEIARQLEVELAEPLVVVEPEVLQDWCPQKHTRCYIPELDVAVVGGGSFDVFTGHELVHALAQRNRLAAPRFLEEGRAEFLGKGQSIGQSIAHCRDISGSAPNFSKAELAERDNRYNGVAEQFVGSLMGEEEGRDALRHLSQKKGRGASPDAIVSAFETEFGYPIEEAWTDAFATPVFSPYGCIAAERSWNEEATLDIDFDLSDGLPDVERRFTMYPAENWRSQRVRIPLEHGQSLEVLVTEQPEEFVLELYGCSCEGANIIHSEKSTSAAYQGSFGGDAVIVIFAGPEGAELSLRLERAG